MLLAVILAIAAGPGVIFLVALLIVLPALLELAGGCLVLLAVLLLVAVII